MIDRLGFRSFDELGALAVAHRYGQTRSAGAGHLSSRSHLSPDGGSLTRAAVHPLAADGYGLVADGYDLVADDSRSRLATGPFDVPQGRRFGCKTESSKTRFGEVFS